MSAKEVPDRKPEFSSWEKALDSMSPERRRSERYDIDTELTARLSPNGPEVMRGYASDISIHGIAGVFVTCWDIGTHVWLEFCLPVCTATMQIQAVVRDRSEYRYGFEFVNLSGRERLLVQRTCRVLALRR